MSVDDIKNTLDRSKQCRCNDGPLNDSCDELITVQPVTRRQLRALAFHYVYALDRSDYQGSLEDVSRLFLDGFGLKPGDHTFALNIAQGVVENHVRYETVIQPLLEHWRFDRLGCCTRLILYMALWEFEQPDAVASIVINEAVELAKAFAERDAYRFVNGILDQVKLLYPHSMANDTELAVHASNGQESSSSSESESSEDAG
ncbi:MAG: transcription antitermination protein NusB [Candidatus Dependentiae bacterium]|nr:transcription antitermination protein NusB [Candidatus Dependentiae bacterium]